MRHKAERHQGAAERTIKDIRRQTRKRYSSEEKIRIALARFRGEIMRRLLSGKQMPKETAGEVGNIALKC